MPQIKYEYLAEQKQVHLQFTADCYFAPFK